MKVGDKVYIYAKKFSNGEYRFSDYTSSGYTIKVPVVIKEIRQDRCNVFPEPKVVFDHNGMVVGGRTNPI